MINQIKNARLDELSEKVIAGVNKALHKLVEDTAAKGESLVIADINGNSKLVPAKELLKNFSKESL